MRGSDGTSGTRSRALEAATVLVFALFLVLPTLVNLVAGDALQPHHFEARLPEPPPRPPASLDDLRIFARGFDAWFGDRFGLRGPLLKARAMLGWFGGGSPSPILARGRGDWVFWDANRALDAWRGVDPLPPETVEAWRRLLEDRRDFVRSRGARFLVVLVPGKAHIYSEYLPRGVERHGPSRYETVLAALERSDVEVLDLRPALRAAKSGDSGDDTLYYRLGFHWTTRGAQVGAAAIARRLAPGVPGLGPPLEGPFDVSTSREVGDSWALRMELGAWVPQTAYVYTPRAGWSTSEDRRSARDVTWVRSADGPRGLLLHDSFGLSLLRPLAESFGELRGVDTYDLDPSDWEELHRDRPEPAVVMQLVSEQGLSRFAPGFTPFVQDPPQTPREELERRFAASAEILLRVYLHYNRPAVRPVGAARVNAAREWAHGGLRVVLEDEAAAVLLPKHRPWSGPAILYLDVQVPRASHLDLLGTPDGVLRYDPVRSRRVALEGGRNRLWIELGPELAAGRLVIRPTLNGRQVSFFHIELRGTE